MEQQVKELLSRIIHPETEQNIVQSGIVESVTAREDKIVVVLCFPKVKDPFAQRIRTLVEQILKEAYPAAAENITIAVKEGTPRAPQPKRESTTVKVGKIIAVASGKGGVGKSTVTANLALTLRNMGYRVGILDADIYGPSQPKMFGCEGYIPDAVQEDGQDYIVPAESMDIELMSIGFFIRPTDALMWRGAMATNALKQLLHQTMWGGLDFLLIDMPPGTGDVPLTVFQSIPIKGIVVVTSPQELVSMIVEKAVKMANLMNVPVLGIVENMSYFTCPNCNEKHYIYGESHINEIAEKFNIPAIGSLPINPHLASLVDGGAIETADTTGLEEIIKKLEELK